MRELELKDVLHFYLGAKCRVANHRSLILRRLEDMTEEECEEASIICGKKRIYLQAYWSGNGNARYMYTTPEQCFRLTRYFLSLGFDLFNLINRGLAIDAKTL